MQLFILLLCLVPAILFILTQQNTLKEIRPENRELSPGLVWLQFIPLFNLYWIFVVVTRIADAISKENISFQDDSILGIVDYDAVEAVGKRPTYKIGMAWCILSLVYFFLIYSVRIFRVPAEGTTLYSTAILLVALGMTICWIIYWVKLAANKRKLMYLHA